jgi:glycosyltransferase involved in cell wall biosynthesis
LRPLRIALLAHARFHAFDMAREMLALGHDVSLFTNYAPAVPERHGVPGDRVEGNRVHGFLSRAAWKVIPRRYGGAIERVSNTQFGRWAARRLAARPWDVVIGWSGVSEEAFRALAGTPTLKVLERGSAHIRAQKRLLEEERERVGAWIETPSDWIVRREEREYALADVIRVLSRFARESFLEQGVPAGRLHCAPLGVDVAAFRAAPAAAEARARRLLAGDPMRVLNVGTFSCQKGMRDLAAVVRELAGGRFEFRFVGPVAEDAAAIRDGLAGRATFVPTRPQARLPAEYEWGDVFVLPTIQDGFALVLCQAMAAGLPVVTTPNCAGPDLIEAGGAGWVVPVRSPAALAERLRWCDGHRGEVADAARRLHAGWKVPDWRDVTARLVGHLEALVGRKGPAPVTVAATAPDARARCGVGRDANGA